MKLAHDILGGKCVQCGSTKYLQVHHKDPSKKKYNIDYATRLSLDKFLEELKKCELLCDSHHSRETHRHNKTMSEHGGGISDKKNCKCILCKNKKKQYMKEYMKNRRAVSLNSEAADS